MGVVTPITRDPATGLSRNAQGGEFLDLTFGGTGAGTPSGARSNLGAAASGANSDIESLSGLKTALSQAQGGTGSSALGSGTIPFTGPAPMLLKDRIAREVDPREWNGFDLIGNNPNDSIVLAALTAAMQTGLPFRSPPGICAMDTGVPLTLTNDLEIDLPNRFIFKHTPNLGAPAITLTCTSRDTYAFMMRGGRFDTSKGKFVQNQQSNSGIGLVRLRRFDFERVWFTGAPDLDTAITTTDSGITWVDCRDGTVRACVFDGMGDCGIYGSGNNDTTTSADDGDEVVIIANHFRRCYAAVNMKRQATRTKFIGNGTYDCAQGFCAWEVSPVLPGRQNIVSSNTFKKTRYSAVNLHTALGGIVSANIIDDFGCVSDGVTASDLPQAVRLLGTEGIICENNAIFCTEWTPGANHVGYNLTSNVFNGTTYPSLNNTVAGGYIKGIYTGVYEGTTQVGPNTFRNIAMSGVTTQFANTSATGSMIEAPSSNGKLIGKTSTATSVAGIQLGRDGFLTAARAGTVSALSIIGTSGPWTNYQINGTTVGQTGYTVPGSGNPYMYYGATGTANTDAGLMASGTGKTFVNTPFALQAYTFAGLPSASSYPGCTVRVSDKNSRLATSDGSSWRYADGTIAA